MSPAWLQIDEQPKSERNWPLTANTFAAKDPRSLKLIRRDTMIVRVAIIVANKSTTEVNRG